jgi:hypothetical protein
MAKLNGNNKGKTSVISSSPAKQKGRSSSLRITPRSLSLDSEPWKTACRIVQCLDMSWLEKNGCPILSLPQPPIFVETLDQLVELQRRLQKCRFLAIDTEWYDRNDDNNKTTTAVSTIQISFLEEDDNKSLPAFVVDLRIQDIEYRRLAQDLVRWMIFQSDNNIRVLGFAVGHDIPLLQTFVGDGTSTSTNTQCLESTNTLLLDLQLVFAVEGRRTKSSMPGLKACAGRYSPTLPLSKEQQCSKWGQRPLSQAQLDYAGMDAAILLVLLAEHSRNMKQQQEQ